MVKVNGKELVKAVSGLKGFGQGNKHLPVLNMALFTVEGSTLTVAGTDLNVAVTATLTCEGDKVRSFATPIKALAETLKGAEGEVTVERVVNQIHVTVGGTTTLLPCLDGEEFPTLLSAKTADLQPASASLNAILDKLLYAASEDATRYNLNGVYIQAERKHAVATDGHRLAMLENVELPVDRNVTISREALEHLGRVMKLNKKEETKMGLGDRASAEDFELVAFQCGNFTITSRLVVGTFPDYQKVIPKKHKSDIEVDVPVEAFAKGIKAVKPKDKYAGITMQFDENILTITSVDKDRKETRTTLPVEYTGKAFKIAFNPNYLADTLGAVDGNTVRLQLSTDMAPALVCDSSNDSHKCVIMPMRI